MTTNMTTTPKTNQCVLRIVLNMMDGSNPHKVPMHKDATIVAVQPHRLGVELYAVAPAAMLASNLLTLAPIEGIETWNLLVVETGVEIMPLCQYLGSAMLPGTKAMHVFRLL